MKLSVVLFVMLVASVYADNEMDARGQKILNTCLAESKLTAEEASMIIREKKRNGKIDCFHACILREQRLLNQDGTVNKDVLAEAVAHHMAQKNEKRAESFQKCCANPKKKLPFCTAGGNIHRCMKEMNSAK